MNRPEKVFPIAHINYDDEIDGNGKVVVPDEVQEAIRTLIRWSGDDPAREARIDTPARVGRAWREYGAGYAEDRCTLIWQVPSRKSAAIMSWCCSRTFPFQSHCEHHMAPIIGQGVDRLICPRTALSAFPSWCGYFNGFSPVALQVQERLTAEVANCHLGQSETAMALPW